jgi:urease accessory protein
MHKDFLLWQLADTGFPAGGFAHSGGLEASVHHGRVTDDTTLRSFARQALAQSGRSALPLVTAAHFNPENLAELDRLSDAFLATAVANRASRAQGRAFLSSAARSFPQAALSPLDDRVRRERLAGHYAPLFGAVLSVLEVDRLETQRLFLYITGRGIGSAGVRLGLIGAYEAQELQTMLAADIDRVIEECGVLAPLEISQTAPLIDLCQSTHDRLYSRLFQS